MSQMKHAHCWHYTSGFMNGLAIAGQDSFRCCRCGEFVAKKWTMQPDPAHGPFCDMKTRVYEDGWTQEPQP